MDQSCPGAGFTHSETLGGSCSRYGTFLIDLAYLGMDRVRFLIYLTLNFMLSLVKYAVSQIKPGSATRDTPFQSGHKASAKDSTLMLSQARKPRFRSIAYAFLESWSSGGPRVLCTGNQSKKRNHQQGEFKAGSTNEQAGNIALINHSMHRA